MENFDGELKSMILKWLKRGHPLEYVRDTLASTLQILDNLPHSQDYLEAIKQGNKANTRESTTID